MLELRTMALSLIVFCFAAFELGDRRAVPDRPTTSSVPSAAADLQGSKEVAQIVEILFENRRAGLPSAASLVAPGGRLVINSFPALSADGSKIAVLYHAFHPMTSAYPTLDVYDTAGLSLRQRFELLPEQQRDVGEHGGDSNLFDPKILTRVEDRIQELNRYLRQERFQPIPALFRFESRKAALTPVENLGMRIVYQFDLDRGLSALAVTSTVAAGKGYEVNMPILPVIDGSGDLYTDCGVVGFPSQGWYEPALQVLVLQLVFSSARDDCDLPDQWLLRQL